MKVLVALCAVAGAFLFLQTIHFLALFVGALCHSRLRRSTERQNLTPSVFPEICIQIPVYNDGLEAVGAIRSLRNQHWTGKATVQVLDDSTDLDSRQAIDLVCSETAPIPVELVRRSHREGFKAGALREGMNRSEANLFGLFDADFRPNADFCHRAWASMEGQPGVGFVQGRWGHRNRDENRLTRSLALGIDVHFSVEQAGRCCLGGILNFNGTAGLWRREAIECAGGWQGDTLTEDLDLSYRAAFVGWKGVFLPDLVADAEIPPTFDVWIRQQRRWAMGSVQVLRKLGPQLCFGRRTLRQKIMGAFHLSHYLIHPAMMVLLLGLALLPSVSMGLAGWITIVITVLCVPITHVWILRSNAERLRWSDVPGQTLLGMAATPYLALAAVQGLFRYRSGFNVTPKGVHARTPSSHGVSWVEFIWALTLILGWYSAFHSSKLAAMILIGWVLGAWVLSWRYRLR